MSLAAALSAGGARPASFLPTIKCSNCGEQIEISAMGEHLCGQAAPSSAHSSVTSTSSNGSSASSNGNPFALRAPSAVNPSKPATPSPLQFDSSEQKPQPAPQTRIRTPTLGSGQAPRAPRPAPPRINPDTANKPFLAPIARPESPISPALSSRSGSSFGGRPPPSRSATSPGGARIFDPRPPSPELSANLDCAFPPFPASSTSSSRPSTSNGRNTPNTDRAPSRGDGSRLDGRWPAERDELDLGPKSPRTNGGENVMERMNTLRSGPFDASRRKPSRDERPEQTAGSLHGRRPSMPQNPPSEPLPSLPTSRFAPSPKPLEDTERAPSPERKDSGDKKGPPQRPARPPTQDCPSPSFLGQFSAEPASIITAKPAISDGSDRIPAFPLPADVAALPELTKVKSEPEMRGRPRRPTLNGEAKSEPSQIPHMPHPPRSQSRTGDRMDYRLDNAPPVPKPVQQLNRSNSQHRPSESGSSTASSVHSTSNTNSSTGGPSPIGSAASSIDAFSPLNFEAEPYGEEKGMRVAGLNVKNQKPGMRAELPREKKSPPRDFSKPMPPREPVAPPPVDDQDLSQPPAGWPLESPMESPMDPAMKMTHGPTPPAIPEERPSGPKRSMTSPANGPPPPSLAIPKPSDDDYDPFRPKSPIPAQPQQPLPHTRARSKTNNGPIPRVASPPQPSIPRSRSPQPVRRPFSPGPPGPPPSQAAAPPASRSAPPAHQPFRPPQPHTQQQQPSRPFSPPQPQPSQQQQPQRPFSPPTQPNGHPLQPPPIPQSAPARPGLNRRPTAGKATCRGCAQQIEGKSVKAADGRLTGRWHKSCFVCRTCTQPFASADFYVMDNQPYCEQHYHEKNGSLCQGCARGIEGQYLETAPLGGPGGGASRKFHPRCFTCADCRVVLSDDYFEIGGRVFCERHALANMRSQARMNGALPGSHPQQQYGPAGYGGAGYGGPHHAPGGGLQLPGGNRNPLTAAKRTTRLMMM